ncbi:intraflagellar transport protein 25 homolog [Pangasianodon hypophthalmus]|uniref:intraflagellar transport protein 25 homolog n=1 Tax=Pangasianodon hypophthalmus TaxID=310915 RepID=UPI000F0099C7|nr:intraflagellar transport protein 25 homolog [Pangasianodon hypophthalmus]
MVMTSMTCDDLRLTCCLATRACVCLSGDDHRLIMLNTALSSFGAQVVLATSSDENHPPESMIDGNMETFWMSTGMFPQEFIIRFPDNMKISLLSIHSVNVRRLRIEKSTQEEAEKFELMAEKEFEQTDGSLQTNEISLDGSNATQLRFLIISGYDHFVSVHKVGIQA